MKKSWISSQWWTKKYKLMWWFLKSSFISKSTVLRAWSYSFRLESPCALMRHLIVQRTDEYRAKSHAAMRWKLSWMIQQSTANLLHDSWFYVIQSIHTFCDTCFVNPSFSIAVSNLIFSSFSSLFSMENTTRGKKDDKHVVTCRQKKFFLFLKSHYEMMIVCLLVITREDSLEVMDCGASFALAKKKPSWFAFLFLFTLKWDGEKIGLRIRIFFVCVREKSVYFYHFIYF